MVVYRSHTRVVLYCALWSESWLVEVQDLVLECKLRLEPLRFQDACELHLTKQNPLSSQ